MIRAWYVSLCLWGYFKIDFTWYTDGDCTMCTGSLLQQLDMDETRMNELRWGWDKKPTCAARSVFLTTHIYTSLFFLISMTQFVNTLSLPLIAYINFSTFSSFRYYNKCFALNKLLWKRVNRLTCWEFGWGWLSSLIIRNPTRYKSYNS